jgi:hypothetical protein
METMGSVLGMIFKQRMAMQQLSAKNGHCVLCKDVGTLNLGDDR